MNLLRTIQHESNFTFKDLTVWLCAAIIFFLSSISVGFCLAEINRQKATIQHLIEADRQDRSAQTAKLKDWGSAAYYNFHLTYDSPSNFAFAAIGQRDHQPWKHRIRILALEGQIYERDVGNPSSALIGRFDFSFLAAFVFPLALILMLYDLRTSERTAGRLNLLESTAIHPSYLWISRTLLRVSPAFLALVIPLIIAGFIASTHFVTLVLAILAVFAYTVFWGLLCYKISTWQKSGSTILMSLIGIWLCTAVILPTGQRLTIDRLVPLPTGADILMLQRETVNDAWDLPREVTMDAFFERHPQWSDYKPVKDSFEWQWYYAFQQVGDQTTEGLAKRYRDGRVQREQIAAWTSLFAPPSLLERTLQSLANTDSISAITYEQSVREFHAELRRFYYPKFYQNQPFDKNTLATLPKFAVEQ